MSNEIKRMFSSIAKNYDKANRMLTMGADVRWRKRTARMCLAKGNNLKILDVATGTGDLALSIAKEAESSGKSVSVLGLDFNKDMLDIADKKIKKNRVLNIDLVEGDALSIDARDSSFDVITAGFALRNFDDLYKFLKESYRVLRPGGRIVFLDAAKPEGPISKFAKTYYMSLVVPAIGAMYNKDAYIYLITSIWDFDTKKLMRWAREVGFRNVKITNMSFGVVYVLTATKPKGK